MNGLFQIIIKWKVVLVLVIFLLVSGTIHFTSFERPRLSTAEEVFRDLLSPVQTGISRISRGISGAIRSLSELANLRRENAALREQLASLQRDVFLLAEYRRENEWLREALDFRDDVSQELLVAEVIGRLPTNWFSAITINRGRNHGVETGMAVVSNVGIVGTVQHVTQRTASIILSTDPQSAVGGLVQETGDLLLVEGDPDHSGMLLAKPLNKDTSLGVGDTVVTSGFSHHYPKGMPVGEVTEIVPGRYDLSFTAVIRPFVDFGRLEYVFVVIYE